MAGQAQDARKLAAHERGDHSLAAEHDAQTQEVSGGEDLAIFRRVEAELTALQDEVRRRAEQRGPHGRRLARLATVVEDARLQAREGVHEAHYGQGQGA